VTAKQSIECAKCGDKAVDGLTLCPHCGSNAHTGLEAGPLERRKGRCPECRRTLHFKAGESSLITVCPLCSEPLGKIEMTGSQRLLVGFSSAMLVFWAAMLFVSIIDSDISLVAMSVGWSLASAAFIYFSLSRRY